MKFPHTSRTVRALGWVSATIFLGAVGSGLWERFLSRAYEWVSNAFLRAAVVIFHGYADVLHRNIGRGQKDDMVMLPYFILMFIIVAFPWVFIFRYTRTLKRLRAGVTSPNPQNKANLDAKAIVETLNKQRKRFLRMGVPGAILITVLYTSMFLEDTYTRKACIFVERSIDILAPYMSSEQLLQTRAQYRSVDNAQKFYDLDARLQSIATSNKVQLPPFTVIRAK
jgi:hypothetical protein